MESCKHCGQLIAQEKSTGWWKHVRTDLYLCANESDMAEPK